MNTLEISILKDYEFLILALNGMKEKGKGRFSRGALIDALYEDEYSLSDSEESKKTNPEVYSLLKGRSFTFRSGMAGRPFNNAMIKLVQFAYIKPVGFREEYIFNFTSQDVENITERARLSPEDLNYFIGLAGNVIKKQESW